MKSLKQASQEVKTAKTGVISDLESLDINLELQTFQGVDFEYDYMEVDGEKYRVPKSVQLQIQDLLKEQPDLTTIKVRQSGTGMNTRYTVIPL